LQEADPSVAALLRDDTVVGCSALSERSARPAYSFIAKSTMLRMATPVGPLASQGRPSSTQQVEAMSRWIQGVSSANSLMNQAPVLAPPPLPLPVLRMSAMSLLIISRYSSSMGMGHIFSPVALALSRNWSR